MIDYKEMEKVIKDLNNYVSKIQKTTETQKKLDESVNEILTIKKDVEEIEKTISKYTKEIEIIEDKHEGIRSQFETVLQDYKKLHSAFELLDVELKKLGIQNECYSKAIDELKELVQKTHQEIETTKNTQKEILNQQKKFAKKLYIWFGIITGMAGIGILMSILKFFI